MAIDIDFKDLAERTIQSQYGTSPHIKALVEKFAKEISTTADISLFFDKIFNPKTAEGVGLDIWGVIVGANRYLPVDKGDYFGFFGSGLHPFDQMPFYHDDGATDVYRMADNSFRELIFLKAWANIADATMPSIKYVIGKIFPKGCIAIKAGHMKIRVMFLSYDIKSYSIALLKKYGLLNLGAGVGWESYIIDPTETFGFDGSGMQTFDNGVFAPYNITQM